MIIREHAQDGLAGTGPSGLSGLDQESVLIVDDNETLLESTTRILRAAGAEVFPALTIAAGMQIAQHEAIGLALLDLNLPDGSGLDLLAQLREMTPELPVIMLTAYGNVRSAVAAMKLGAVDYLEKPFSPADLELAIERAMTLDALRREIRQLRRIIPGSRGSVIPGDSAAMRTIWRLVETVAPTDANVLIIGESGTGKEIIARAIHAASTRSSGPFIPVNCGGIPETLVEDQLFGHEAHAFTDARAMRRGDFELADRGSIFLDEIGEMPLNSQPALLRVLDQRRFMRIGGERELRVDVRVIAATNRNLDEAVEQGTFRQDLLFRLNVFTVTVPPLRDRREDLPLLVAAFLRDIGQSLGKTKRRLAPETLQQLVAYDWPGNLRQLRNVIEHALILCQGSVIVPEHLPAEIRGQSAGMPDVPDATTRWEQWFDQIPGDDLSLNAISDRLERHLVLRALRLAGGRKAEAARALGLTSDLLRYRLQKHGLRTDGGDGQHDRLGTTPEEGF